MKLHIPHRLCLLLAFRERQRWFFEEMRAGRLSGDLLRCAKDTALISIRFFANFLGLRLGKKDRKIIDTSKPESFFKGTGEDDVFVDRLCGNFVKLCNLSHDDKSLLEGLLRRADKELAHFTSDFECHDSHNTAKAICDGITLIGRLLRECLYEATRKQFPPLREEREIHDDKWYFCWNIEGPDPSFTRKPAT